MHKIIFFFNFSYRWPHPLHILCFGGMGCELLEAQRWRLSREAGILEQVAQLHTLLLQRLIVLVGKKYSSVHRPHALCPEPVGIYACRDPSSRIHAGARQKYGAGGRVCTETFINSSRLISWTVLPESYDTSKTKK